MFPRIISQPPPPYSTLPPPRLDAAGRVIISGQNIAGQPQTGLVAPAHVQLPVQPQAVLNPAYYLSQIQPQVQQSYLPFPAPPQIQYPYYPQIPYQYPPQQTHHTYLPQQTYTYPPLHYQPQLQTQIQPQPQPQLQAPSFNYPLPYHIHPSTYLPVIPAPSFLGLPKGATVRMFPVTGPNGYIVWMPESEVKKMLRRVRRR